MFYYSLQFLSPPFFSFSGAKARNFDEQLNRQLLYKIDLMCTERIQKAREFVG
jgi:hypothetical protein